MYICIERDVCVCMCIYIYIYMYRYTYIYIYIYVDNNNHNNNNGGGHEGLAIPLLKHAVAYVAKGRPSAIALLSFDAEINIESTICSQRP